MSEKNISCALLIGGLKRSFLAKGISTLFKFVKIHRYFCEGN